jgi:hypothetical protein
MARYKAQERPESPSVRCMAAARHALGAQPTMSQESGRLSSRSHLVQVPCPTLRAMPINSNILSSLANHYAQGMTSIRGRRVQRLLKREFAGAEHVLMVRVGSGATAVLGLSATGAAFCATDGRGKHASVVKWLHGSAEALETRFDLLKDSLPALGTMSLPLADLRGKARVRVSAGSIPPQARALAALALQALA